VEKVAALAWIRRPDSRGIDGQNQWNKHFTPFNSYNDERSGFNRGFNPNTSPFIKLRQSKKCWLTYSYLSYRLSLLSILIIEVK